MKKIILTAAVALGLTMASCDSYLDINESPNSPAQSNLTPDLIFPGAEMAFANSYGDFLRITGGYFAQHYAQYFGTSNYMDYSQFQMSAVRSSSTYQNLTMRVLQNLSTVKAMAEESDEPGTVLAATVIRAAVYQVLVDCYGEIPYSEALNPDNLNPKYDNGKDIYAGIIAELDEAIAKTEPTATVCTNNLLPGARASEWIKLANALKLRILMRECGVVDVKAELEALVKENNFPDSDVAWAGCWSNQSGQANPFYQEDFATYFGSTQQNVILNLALYATMDDSADPRLQAFFDPNTDKGQYTGGVSGTNFSTTSDYKAGYWCRPHMAYDSPVYFISRFETEFFLAEYHARYGTMEEAEAHYTAAVEASFASAGLSDTSTVLATYPWNANGWKECIGVQKWVALSGTNNFEAWCELRRLGYPAFGSVTGAQIYDVVNDVYTPSLLPAATLYTPIQVIPSVGADKLLQRWPYPESSANRNSNTPAAKGDTTPVFWGE